MLSVVRCERRFIDHRVAIVDRRISSSGIARERAKTSVSASESESERLSSRSKQACCCALFVVESGRNECRRAKVRGRVRPLRVKREVGRLGIFLSRPRKGERRFRGGSLRVAVTRDAGSVVVRRKRKEEECRGEGGERGRCEVGERRRCVGRERVREGERVVVAAAASRGSVAAPG